MLPRTTPSRRVGRLIDDATGAQTEATRSMQSRIEGLARERHPRFEVVPFDAASAARAPLVLLGSLAPARPPGAAPAAGPAEAYRIWLVLADLRTGRIVARGVARARAADVSPAPLPFHRDSPAWRAREASTDAYLEACAGQPGDPLPPAYLEGVLTAALVADATRAYDAGRYRDALDLYAAAARTPAGDQLRVRNGLYLTNWRLGRRADAAAAFDRVVEYGLDRRNIAVKFLFEPGSTLFLADPAVSSPYGAWLEQIAGRAAGRGVCLGITGHASPTGTAPINDRLSLLRAQKVEAQLVGAEVGLRGRTRASGAGSRRPIVGTGADDASDALDRRVEFDVEDCRRLAAAG
jgi:outer membrane protein OmpA-like peptidoglycan-associated protein